MHPALAWRSTGAFRAGNSGQAPLRNPGPTRLGLLPSGPDPIHGAPPRRTRLSTSSSPGAARQTATLGRGIQPRMRGFRVEGTPSAPLSTVAAMVVLHGVRSAVASGSAAGSGTRLPRAATFLRWTSITWVVGRFLPRDGWSGVQSRQAAAAEGEGFEPSRRLTPPTRFPGVRTRPDYAIPPKVREV